MHPFSFPPLILFSLLLFSLFALIASFPSDVSAAPFSSDCLQTFDCGPLKNLSYPFTLRDDCGLPEFRLTCENDSPKLAVGSISYLILRLNQTEKTMTLARSDLWNNTCPHEFFNSTLNRDVFDYGKVNEDLTIYYGCSSNLTQRPSNLFNCSIDGNPSSNAYFLVGPIPTDPILSVISCTVGVRVKILKTAEAELTNNRSMLREVLMEGFNVNYSTCANCLVSGGRCGFDSDLAQPICLCDNQPCPAQDDKGKRSTGSSLVVGLGVGGAGIVGLLLCFWIFFIMKRRKRLANESKSKDLSTPPSTIGVPAASINFSQSTPSYPFLKSDLEKGSTYFGAHIFSYEELEEATDNFDSSRELGDGGFGKVYYDVTHISTAPQGTPGYVDPEYYQCYQLTAKSDVFSFGVVLIELISSLPAVDTNRQRHNINLANMAISKIQDHALDELVDPFLGFEKDYTVRRMTTSVAGLAFRCLQQDRDMRPSMDEVLEDLRRIQNEEIGVQKAEVVDISADDVGLLKNFPPPLSPDLVVVTDKLVSSSTTPNSF